MTTRISARLAETLSLVPDWSTDGEMIPDFRDEYGQGWFWEWERFEEPKKTFCEWWIVWVRNEDDDCA